MATTAASVAPGDAPTATPGHPTVDDWGRIAAAKKIVIGVSADYLPYAFFSSDFKLDGFDIALAEDISRRLGVQVEFNDFAFDGLLEALQLKQVDAAIGAISMTPDRQAVVDFSAPYYIGQEGILAAADSPISVIRSAADMAGKKIGVQRGTVYETWLTESLVSTGLIPPANLQAKVSSEDVLRALRAKEIDLAVMNLIPAEAQAKFGGVKLVGQGTNAENLAIAVRKGSNLSQFINNALAQARADGTIAKLTETYLQQKQNEVAPIPTMAPESRPTVAAAAPQATAELPTVPGCLESMTYVADLSFDDKGMTAPPTLQPSQTFGKGWRVQNSGNCPWGADYALVFVRGNVPDARMGGRVVPVGREVKPGETVDLQASLVAPVAPGVYQGLWQMRSSAGEYFGETVWVGIQIPGAPAAPPAIPELRLRADATSISAGQCTTIRWNIDNINSISLVDPGGAAQGVGGNDARNVCPGATSIYVLRIGLKDGRTVEQPITITVNGAAPNFRADRAQINAGECTNLRWNIDGVSGVYFGDGGGEQGVGGNDTRVVCPGGTTTYRLRVTFNGGGEIQQTVMVNVSGTPATNINFRAANSTINRGECTNLIWEVTNAKAVYLNQGAGEALVGLKASDIKTCPEQTNTYTLRVVRNDDQVESRSMVIAVNQPAAPVRPSIDSFTHDRPGNSISAGQCLYISWTTRNVPSNLVIKRGDTILQDNAPASGSLQDCPSSPGLTTYTIIAAGENIGDTVVTQSFTLDVRANG